jgi:NtrC-family two-component system response regulator AlgB
MKTSGLRVLLVDDDRNIRRMLEASLQEAGAQVRSAESAEAALKLLQEAGAGSFELMLTDHRMGGKNGVELIVEARRRDSEMLCVVMTAFASFDNAVEAVKAGAFDYLPKPFSNAQLEHLLSKVATVSRLRRENRGLRASTGRDSYFSGFLSPAMRRLEDFVRKVSPTEETLLLVGESGTGKSALARTIHERSSRAAGPLVTVFCSTLAESVLESELFGHAKGSFTGATQERPGKFETAQHGTLFLDEIGELSATAQARLLRFLQDKVVERVGSNEAIPVDTRIIAATNRNLEEDVASGRFREDLYYRLNILQCNLVALRHRKEDLPVLIKRFSEEAALARGRNSAPQLDSKDLETLLSYDWPGNLRELKNVIERLILLSEGAKLDLGTLPEAFFRPKTPSRDSGSIRKLEDLEREAIVAALQLEPNMEKVAAALGITTVTLWRKRKQYGLP